MYIAVRSEPNARLTSILPSRFSALKMLTGITCSFHREGVYCSTVRLSARLDCRLLRIDQPGSSGLEVALLGETRGPACRGLVAVSGSGTVAGHFEQMCADCVEAVVLSNVLVGVECPQQVECGLRAPHHRDRYGAVERDHWIGRDAFE